MVLRMARARLVLIDGYSLLFRAFYGTRPLSTSDGRPTNALFGFVTNLIQIFKDFEPDCILVALDAPGKTFRHADFAEYKGTRTDPPEELSFQLESSRKLLADLNIPSLEEPGYEADDIIGTLSRIAESKGYDTTIVTGDHDALQLVDECVTVYTPSVGPRKAKSYDPAAVVERYGFGPEHITDYKGMAGDSSDNIPGVKGVGDKTATKLIQDYGDVEQIIAAMEEIPDKFRKKLEPAIEDMRLSKKLATIDRESPVQFDFAPYKVEVEQAEQALGALKELEFKSQVERLAEVLNPYFEGDKELTADVGREEIAFEDAGEIGDLHSFIGLEEFALYPDEEGWRVAVGSKVGHAPSGMVEGSFDELAGRTIGHGLKPLYRTTGATEPPAFDTQVAAYVEKSDRGDYDLEQMCVAHLDRVASTASHKAAAIAPLRDLLKDMVADSDQKQILNDIELPLIPILAELEANGILTSAEMLEQFSKELEREVETVQQRIHETAGEEFNIGSPKQIGEVLFGKMELPGGRKTKTGWATGAEILSDLAAEHSIAADILSWRELTKLKGTYADALPKLIREDGRIHTTFAQTVAATGRLSSNDPNMQNIPIRTELGRTIRKAFYAPEGMELLSLDYSQIELRILAHMCGDENLVAAFQDGRDIHTATAAQMFGVELEKVDKSQRGLAKMLNYAVLYGVSGFGLSNQLGAGFSPADAKELITQYNERFPKVKAFTNDMIEKTRNQGFTETMSGRRRYFPDINASNRQRRQYAERQAMNAPIQGTAADMIKIAMINVRSKVGPDDARMLLQVHDELLFEAKTRDAVETIRTEMEQALPLDVPVVADAKAGPNWLEMTTIS